MKKKLSFVIVAIATIAVASIFILFNKQDKRKTAQEKFLEMKKNHPYYKRMKLSKEERLKQGLPPNKYFEQKFLLEMSPITGTTHQDNIYKLQRDLEKTRKLSRVPGDAGDNAWVERGPNNQGGRTRVVMFDPNDPNHNRVFAGGVSGGLWVNNDITNANSSWSQVNVAENLAITCMTVDPNNSQIMYIGTGESYTSDNGFGNGVWKTTDGGTTWANVYRDLDNPNIRERLYYINDILAWNNPNTNQTEIFIGVAGEIYRLSGQTIGGDRTGLYKSIDGGASWNLIDNPVSPTSQYEPNDFEIDSDNNIWFGTRINTNNLGGGRVFKSTDGTNFTLEHTITNAGRTEIAVSATDPDKIYILARGFSSTTPVIMQRTVDGFITTSNMALPNDADEGIPANDFTRGQAFYDLEIEVDPSNDNILYVGGIDLFRSVNGGASWTQISRWSNSIPRTIPQVHADQHAITFHPTDPNKAVVGNDGGVYYVATLSGASSNIAAILSRNRDYNTLQFYNGAIGQNSSNEKLLAGAQDNGSQFIDNASSGVNPGIDIFGGDGAYSFIDKDGQYMIVSYVYNTKARANLPYDGTGIIIDEDEDTGSFINPQALDDNLDILYSNGDRSIIRYSGIAPGQSLVRNVISNFLLNVEATALAVSPFTTNSTTLFIGLGTGQVLRVQNANQSTQSWTRIYSGPSSGGSVSSISFGNNENEIIVTYYNYNLNENVIYTSDGGASWSNKEGDLPDIPVKTALMNPLNSEEVILGTELGVWRTQNFSDVNPIWVQSYNGMSSVAVTSLELRSSDNTVLATTYGRGMFTGRFTAESLSVDDVLADKKAFTVYPTISDGNIKLFAKNTLGQTTISVYSINGKEVFSSKIDFSSNQENQLSLNLTSGIYILNLIDSSGKKASEKIIIR